LPSSTAVQEEELHWLALKMVPGLGTRRSALLIEQFRSPLGVFRASESDLVAAGVAGSQARSIASGCSFEDAVEQHQRVLSTGTVMIPITDERYPEKLRSIFDPPLILFARGRIQLLESICIGVVGTRRATPYGLAASERLSSDLAAGGITIVSGLARGIDTAAHRAVLSQKGNTIAVLGCGVDLVYPSENKKLVAEIMAQGLVLSEFPMGAPPYPQNFPVRNRIISGLSSGVIVVEGAQYSGSSITARLAMDQGREVFAVPGNITSKMSWGPNLLIKQGAKLVQDWNDVVQELPVEERRQLAQRNQRELNLTGEGETPAPEKSDDPQAPLKKELLSLITIDIPLHLDALLETLEYHSSSEVIAALFDLEMLGLVRQLPGRTFVKVW